ncbi:MAG: chemotaxis protein CheW [Desulfatibacillaceae bacterium]
MSWDDSNRDAGAVGAKRDRLAEMREVLDRIQAQQEETEARKRETRRKVLHDRAFELGRTDGEHTSDEQTIQVVDFILGGERYAIELAHIREVYPLRDLTPLPCTPSFVVGIVNIRSQILSIVDLKDFFDLPDGGLTDARKIIILSSKDMEFGVLADDILGTRNVPVDTVQASMPTLTGIRAEYLYGVTGDRVVILDGAKILKDPGIVVEKEATG